MNRVHRRLAFWQGITIALLFIGYAGYYLCRSDFSVSLPLIIDEFAAHGMPPAQAKIRLGAVTSIAVLAYAMGKFFLAGIADFLSGKRNFLTGMGGSILFALLSLAGGLPVFTLAWIGNRLAQSTGWAGMVKITSRWFSYSSYGAAMGAISLSYLFGDAVARQFMGFLIGHGFGWRAVFQVAAGTLFVIFIANLLLLKESRIQIGLAEPEVNSLNLYGVEGSDPKPSSLRDLLRPLLRSPAFQIVCALSLGTTLVRETFNTWTPTYFNQVVGYSKAEAAGMSSVFPLFGGVSVLLSGFWSDRLGRGGRSAIMFYSLLLSSFALFALGSLRAGGGHILPTVLVGLVGFLVIGPYAYLAGAIALDFGGKHGGATSSGIIDGVGYLGGILAGRHRGAHFGEFRVDWSVPGAGGRRVAFERGGRAPVYAPAAGSLSARGVAVMRISDRIIEIFEAKGGAAYFGEPVSQLEHALQAAYHAERENAPPWLVAAALLHDIGHLLHAMPEHVADLGIDARQEDFGHAWLAQYFGPEATAPVRMHVDAKRYLCATDEEYLSQLSPASVQSLQLQGGFFSGGEAREFERRPFVREAVRLRRWDDLAKVPGMRVPGLEHYRAMIEASQLRAS